jgi:rsbT antagonist protein RsbS
MDSQQDERRIPISMVNGAIFASLQVTPVPQLMAWLREDLLNMAKQHRSRLALLDLSGIVSMDEQEYTDIIDTAKMLKLMGVQTILVGMRPGIIAGLSAIGADLTVLPGVCDLEQALEY